MPFFIAAATQVAQAVNQLPGAVATAAAATGKAAKATVTAAPLPADVQNFQFSTHGPQTPLAQHAGWLTHSFAGLFILAAVLLIVLLAVQTTKQEGLSGTIGGQVQSAYKGRLGADRQIARITTVVAVVYIVMSTLLALSGI